MIRLSEISANRGSFKLNLSSLNLRSGELVAVLGNNGSGKSTFLAVLAGLLNYQGGYRLLDADFQSYPHKDKYRLTGFLSQRTELNMPFDVFYVILTGRFAHTDGYRYSKQDYEITEETLKTCDIEHLRNRPFNQLSGGEKQRVLLARTINQHSPILLLDEPLNGIDLKHQHQTIEQLHQLKVEKMVLVVMHDLALAVREFDRFLVFSEGQLAYDATKDDIDTGRLAELFQVQFDLWKQEDKTYVYTSA